jgi:hypothetical protein
MAGRLDGSVHVLLAEDVKLTGSVQITGDLLVPGTPLITVHGSPAYDGTIDGVGNAAPSTHHVTIRGSASLRHVIRRTDPVAFPSVPTPPTPIGTVDVVLTLPGETVADFATLRNLKLDESVGEIAVPPGTYGAFSAAGGSGFTLGVAGALEPAVYDLQGLALAAGSSLNVVGPVIINVGNAVVFAGNAGNPGEPGWLAVNVASGGVTINGATVNGYVVAPAGAVTVKEGGTLRGGVVTGQLVIREGAAVQQP